MKHIALDLVRVTEAAAIAAATHVGRGDKIAADAAATTAMRGRLNRIPFRGRIAIGEGKKDDAPGLFGGELVGADWATCPPNERETTDYQEIAVDPIEGTTPTAKGGYEALSVLAMGGKNSLFASECHYMKKLAYGPRIAKRTDLRVTDPLDRLVRMISLATGREPGRITVCILDRPRHESLIQEFRELGCRIKLISDCDVSGALATAFGKSGIDLYYGVGGAPEGVISAAALKCVGGSFQGQLCDRDCNVLDDTVLEMDDLARGDVVFCATGITDGSLLKGVRFEESGAVSNSIIMRSESGTVRYIETHHGN